VGPGGACLGDERLGRVTADGIWRTGWPRRPQPAIQGAQCQPLELAVGTDPSYLFATRDGRLYLTDAGGVVATGYPAAGPADLTATPLLVSRRHEGVDQLVLAVAGTTPAVTGVDAQDETLETAPVARLRTWNLPITDEAVAPAGAMYGGLAWRGGALASFDEEPADPSAALASHHVCYPQPLTASELKVRGWTAETGPARAVILNLQGETVRDTGEVTVTGGTPFELLIDMTGVASGLYVCTLQAGGERSVKTIAVAR
jgi:hypothetical protein